MDDGHPFIDYYAIIDVDPQCSARALELAYRHLAKIYHPDHPETADLDRFNSITEAYSLLRRPDKRAAYDTLYASNTGYSFAPKTAQHGATMAAISDGAMHANILMHLYKRRRECARSPGVGTYEIIRSLECSDENFEFHAWYLRKKGFIEHTEDGQYAITVEGVDHVIATSEAAERTLRITRSDEAEPDYWTEREGAGATVQ